MKAILILLMLVFSSLFLFFLWSVAVIVLYVKQEVDDD